MKQSPSRGVERLWRVPLFSLGALLVVFAVLMAMTALFDVVGGESARGDVGASVLAFFVGVALMITFRRVEPIERISLRSAFLVTALGWLIMPLFAAAPFALAPEADRLTFTDAVFEAVSGVTTTGSTVISGLDDYPAGLLLWRSLLQWIGGVGIILMAVVILPFLRVGGMQLFQLESSDRSADRVIPQAGALVLWIVCIYVALSCLCAVAYAAAGMSVFDAVNHAMTTLSTGGFSTHDLSIGAYDSEALRWTATAFMLAGALPFVAYVKLMRGARRAELIRDTQIRWFLGGLVALVAAAQAGRWIVHGAGAGTFSHTALNLVSIVTTTGYASEDYQLWGTGFVALAFALTFFGGCAGSTSGGIKVYRFQLLFLMARDYMRGLYEPNVVRRRAYAGKPIDDELIHAVLAFMAIYVGAVSAGSVALAWTGLDFVTALSAAASAIGNVGPGVGDVIGPAGNFGLLPDAAKWMLMGLMLLGRLELFAILVLVDPRFWRG